MLKPNKFEYVSETLYFMLKFATAALLFEFILDIIYGFHFVAVFELIVAVICYYMYSNFDKLIKNNTISMLAFISSNLLFIIILYSLFHQNISVTVFFWIPVIPICAYTLNGLRVGSILTTIYVPCCILMLFLSKKISFEILDVQYIANFLLSVLSVWVFTHNYEKTNETVQKNWRNLASLDTLTELKNRRIFHEICQVNQNRKLSLILVDLDWFKKINDTYGHTVGDIVLKEIASILQKFESNNVHAFRLGGEEFALLLINHNNVESVAKDVLKAIQSKSILHDNQSICITASLGVSTIKKCAKNIDELMTGADNNLYVAKNNGRNQIVM